MPAVAAVALLAVAPPAAIAGGAAPAVAVAGHSARDWLFAALASLLILALLAALAALGRTRRRLPQAPSGLPALPPGTPQDERARRLREGADHHGRPWRQLGELLRERGALSPGRLRLALETQERTGGRLGEILVAAGAVAAADVTDALGRQLELPAVAPGAEPLALLSAPEAHALRAVALKPDDAGPSAPLPVAVADPGVPALASLEGWLGRPVELRLGDEAALDRLLGNVYGEDEIAEVTGALHEEAPELSAYRMRLSAAQIAVLCALGFLVLAGLLTDVSATAVSLVGAATAFFVVSTAFRFLAAHQGWHSDATVAPPAREVAAMDERELPPYTILLPVYMEKPSTMRALFDALSRLDYPKHKLDGVLLVEADDDFTLDAVAAVGKPAWMRVVTVPEGVPRTKPRAMAFGLLYAKGEFLTVYDAEDKPDPAQIKKAVWAFRRAGPSLACLQAKLGYYNPRQNLLTRWFTLEYDAWFNIFLPGLHRIGGPIPLGGTSNHFRTGVLERCFGWDPYNVTEDADLGLRFTRLSLTTAMLESTTEEEANSRLGNWVRQRSRWSKGYMQTLLVHTRHPLRLLRELGPKAFAVFLLTIGGTVATALLAPVFWGLLVLWVYGQPAWVADLFPPLIYYPALACLLLGNFLLIFLGVVAAVVRGHDDLAAHALLMPVYWLLMSAATYRAVYDLVVRPHHWHKTEHGLHFAEEPA